MQVLATPAPAKPSVERVGDVDEPLAVFERFLAAVASNTLNSDEGRALLAGELAKEPYEKDEQPLGPCDAIVRIDDRNAVARVTVHDPGGKSFEMEKGLELHTPPVDTNLYFYLVKSDAWRVTTVRALAQTWFQMSIVALDEAYPQQEPKLREMADNARMTLMSDQQVVTWFAAHRSELEALASRTLELAQGKAATFATESELGGDLLALHLNSSEVDGDRTVTIVIGGITDNTVGVMQLPQPAALPHIEPNERIWAQPLGGGWFLFRTT